ncbi:MAG: FAD-dependent monooxygenase [Gammaproteobacteria bacterium]|jgi:2-octaprenyl-6-methoxyphenol hydroxylase|nr:FAD-dependent monooxygenase [Gammaproteobacteria bacterium]
MPDQTANTLMTDVDVAIVGGGLVGASLALALRDSGLRIAVIEAFTASADQQPSYDDRTLVINEVSGQILRQLGLAALLRDQGVAITGIHVTDQGRPGRTLLQAAAHGREQFGHVLVAREIGRAMLQAINNQAGVTSPELRTDEPVPKRQQLLEPQCSAQLQWLAPARLEGLRYVDNGVELQLTGAQSTLTTRLVVGADGADSAVRHLTGLPVRQHDYQQTAIICNASTQRISSGMAYERFGEHGPLALLPQPAGRLGVVMCVHTAQADGLLGLNDADFMQQLQLRFGYRLGRFERIGKRASYPLRLVAAQKHVRERVVLIGNAAHTIHPVSAQGFNLGLRDAWQLAASLLAAQRDGKDIASVDVLQCYQQTRDLDQRETIRYTDTLARLYSNPSLLARGLRSAALLAHQWLPGLQQSLVNRAMGYRSQFSATPFVVTPPSNEEHAQYD